MFLRLEFVCAAVLLCVIVTLVAVASVSRYYGTPIIWSIEVAQLLFIWLCMLAADIALQKSRHFGLSILQDRLGPKGAAVADAINILLVLVLLAYLLVWSIDVVRLSHPRLTGATQMPFSYVNAALTFGLVLMIRTLAVDLLRTLKAVRAGAAER